LLLVSHDRALLDAVGKRTVAFEDGTLHSYVGGWPEYVRVREERAAKPKSKPAPRRSAAGGTRNGGASLHRLEEQIEQAEAALKALEDELADPSAWSTPERTAKSTKRHEAAKQKVERLYEKWVAT